MKDKIKENKDIVFYSLCDKLLSINNKLDITVDCTHSKPLVKVIIELDATTNNDIDAIFKVLNNQKECGWSVTHIF